MDLFPAVDLIDNKCVRLTQGRYDVVKTFGDPIETVSEFISAGATNLHIVDLMAAKSGTMSQLDTVKAIRETYPSLFIEYGGGIRDLNRLKTLNDIGIDRMIVSTAAIKDVAFTRMAIEIYKNQIALGLDTKDSVVAVNGWTKKTPLTIEEALRPYADLSQQISAIIVTDVSKDGMLEGPNFKQLEQVLSITDIPLVASGGISSVKDLEKLKSITFNGRSVVGSIVGMAIYTGSIDIKEAIRQCTQ